MKIIKQRVIKLHQQDGNYYFNAYVVFITGRFLFFPITKKLWLTKVAIQDIYFLSGYPHGLFVDQKDISKILQRATEEYVKEYKSNKTIKKEVFIDLC